MLLQPGINSDVSWKVATSTLPRWVGVLVLPSPVEIQLLADLMEWSRERERV